MYTYKNKVTGAVVNTFGKVTGGDWVQVKDTKAKTATKNEKESDCE